MLDSSHVRFAAKIEWRNHYHYTSLYSYWMDWLILKDVLNTACNITNAAYKRWAGGRVEGEGWWVNNALRHRQPSCVQSVPDRWPQQPGSYHEESRRRVEQFGTTGYPINAPQ